MKIQKPLTKFTKYTEYTETGGGRGFEGFEGFVSDFRASDFLYTGGGFYDRINWNERAEGAENLDSGNCSANCNTQNGNPDIQTELLWLHHASTRTGSSTSLLKLLLQDKTTGRNILWGTDACADRGGLYRQDQQIRPELITGPNSDIIRTRAEKAADQQAARTRQHAEVFTPLWVCDRMNNDLDTVWFRTPGKFRNNGQPTERVRFTKKHRWTTCVDSRRLEITCGEAPFLVSRYDAATGEPVPIRDRVGLLDRKLRAVNENAADEAEWWVWTQRAFQATCGYELQGDNLLIARINLLLTFEDYCRARWQRDPSPLEFQTIAEIIVRNLWQMNGLTGTVPGYVPEIIEEPQLVMDELADLAPQPLVLDPTAGTAVPCRIRNWRQNRTLEYREVNQGGKRKNMKFDFVIGNPPYQDESNGESRNYAPPIYNLFMDASYEVGDAVELIHPAGFLFNAGSTWRISMTIPRTRCFWRSPASQKKISASCATAETANFVEADAAEAAKAGTLAQLVNEKFG